MNCNLRVQAGPENKEEVTSPSWENREKFAASREVFPMEEKRQKHGYIISSYEPLANLFFLYFNTGPNNNKTKINKKKKKKMLQEFFFCKPLTCFILILFLFFNRANSEEF